MLRLEPTPYFIQAMYAVKTTAVSIQKSLHLKKSRVVLDRRAGQ